jgi:putative intracellular protease/amidase
MNRRLSICFITVLLVSLMGCSPQSEKVLMILQEKPSADLELMLDKEVGVMKTMLEEAGYQVVTASSSGRPLVADTLTLTPNMKLADVKVADYAGVLVPCLASEIDNTFPPEAIEIVKEASEQGKPIAADMSGILLLNSAGILDGKQFSMVSEMAGFVPKGIYKGEGVVQDGNIITNAICPFMAREMSKTDGTPELTQKFIDTLKAQN